MFMFSVFNIENSLDVVAIQQLVNLKWLAHHSTEKALQEGSPDGGVGSPFQQENLSSHCQQSV